MEVWLFGGLLNFPSFLLVSALSIFFSVFPAAFPFYLSFPIMIAVIMIAVIATATFPANSMHELFLLRAVRGEGASKVVFHWSVA